MRIMRTMLWALFLMSAAGFCFGQDIGCPKFVLFGDSGDVHKSLRPAIYTEAAPLVKPGEISSGLQLDSNYAGSTTKHFFEHEIFETGIVLNQGDGLNCSFNNDSTLEDAQIPLPASEAFKRWRLTHSGSDAISANIALKDNMPSTRAAKKKASYPKSEFWDVFGEYTLAGTVAAIGGYLIWGGNITWSESIYRKAIGGYLILIAIAHMLCPSCD